MLASAQVEQVFGYPPDELLGEPLEKLVPKRFHDRHAEHRAEYFSDPHTRPMGAGLDLYGVRADGSEFPAEISISSIDTEDGPIATAAVRDITDRVGAEREREKLEAELKLNQSRRLESVGQLAGGIAHDFNNLLGLILNYAEFAAAELVDRPKVRQDVQEITAAAQRAADLTRQLLTFSRREVVKLEPLNLNTVLTDFEKLLRRTLGEHVSLNVKPGDGLWTVTADHGQIEQVLINLAVNARDAMPKGGVLEIDTANIELDDEFISTHPDTPKPGRYVRLTVADSGFGMEDDVRERAFEPFFSTKPPAKGTGLGLATVYGIVKQSGGNVFLYSEPGRGTTVRIHLPAGGERATTGGTRSDAPPQGHGQRIMVVEDDGAVRRMVSRMLASHGYRVSEFAKGIDALRLCQDSSAQFDLLLTDIVMPEMQGSELASRAREVRPGLKVLFMSGYSDAIIAQQDLERGPHNLLEKPFTGSELLRAVGETLETAKAR